MMPPLRLLLSRGPRGKLGTVNCARTFLALILPLLVMQSPAQRINQEGRILGALPVVTNSILFDTNAADAVVSAMQIFPVTNPWNENISRLPILINSDAMNAQIM